MTRRFWRFASTALIGTVIVAVALALAYGRLTVKNLTELGAEQNTTLARSLSNAARAPLENLLGQSPDLSANELRNSAASSELQSVLSSLVRDLSVVKVKVFNAHGITIFATDPARIGEVATGNKGYIAALAGETAGGIVRRDTLNTFDQRIERRDLIQTYIPIRNPDDVITGVFEVYSDVTPLLARITSTQRGIIAGVVSTMGLFYLLLVWLFQRTDRQLQREQVVTQSYLKEIEATNETLEDRVAERTRELEKSRNFLQTAIDGVPDPAIIIDKEFRITSMNKVAREAFGADKRSGDAFYCYRALYGRDSPCEDLENACTLVCGQATKNIEDRVDANGGIQHVEIRTTPLRGSDGEITGAVAVAHDLSEREQIAYKLRQAKERAETASQVKSEFVAMMSHEIRTPMNAVLGMTDLLRLTHLTRKQLGYIHTIQSSGNMLLSLLDNILDFTKMGAGALLIQKREFDVIELLERVLEIMGHHAYSKGLELVGSLDTDMALRVLGDRNRLRQILVNLARNAVTYSDRGEIVIRISVGSEKDGLINLLFSVSDCGIGMTDEVKSELFTPFSNVGEQAAEQQQGSGLGLTICKQLLGQMGGEIGVDSEPGEGTRVWFTVPVERKAPHGTDLAGNMLALRGKRILTVHRSAVIDQAICSYAMAWGMACDVATTDDEALASLQTAAKNGQPYAAAIIDIALHDTNGLTLARRIRASDDVSLLPIVVLTPISKSLKPGKISSIGIIRCVNKPVLPTELLLSLTELIDAGGLPVVENVHSDDNEEDNAQLRILVAEDNPVNRQVLTRMLKSLGYNADCVDDGPAVLEALSNEPYNVVLMDCQMPGMDGEQVTEEIRNVEHRFSTQPIIVAVTADASHEHRLACLAAGMDDFIGKPLRVGKLGSGLQRWKSLLAARADDAANSGEDSASARAPELLADLHQRTGSRDEFFLSNYIDLFLSDTEARLDKLSDALEKQDAVALKRECHSLKGACLEFGVTRMHRCCDELCDSAESGKLGEVPGQLLLLRREFDRIRPVFEAEKALQANRSSPD